MPSQIFELCDEYVSRYAALHPITAAFWGVRGHEGEATDLSPAGEASRAELARDVVRRLDGLASTGRADDLAALHLRERLRADLDLHDIGESLRDVVGGFGTLRMIRSSVDLLPRQTEEDWQTIAAALRAVPATLATWRLTIGEGLATGKTAARRQALALAKQAAAFADGTHDGLVNAYGGPSRADLLGAAAAAHAAYADAARYLAEEYAPHAAEQDGFGEERYQVWARLMLGCAVDVRETYAWAWDELYRVEAEMAREAALIIPGGDVSEAITELDATEYVEGEDAYLAWLQERHDTAIRELDGRVFDIDPAIRRVEACLAPEPDGSAPYYIGPSEDLSRPGRTFWPSGRRTRFSVWHELTTVFHEGTPGHHLQIGQRRALGDRLSRFSRLVGVSGQSEGWALYAERLADELGWYTRPGSRLGHLSAQALRALRVVIDLGVHIGLPLPAKEAERYGTHWTFDNTLAMLRERARIVPHRAEGEAARYFGRAAQASCYKLGERAWLAAREAARREAGPDFDLKAWHTAALDIGPLALDALQPALQAHLS